MAPRKKAGAERGASRNAAKGDAPKGPKPQASINNWQSVGSSAARRYLFLSPAHDLRRDLTPYDRLTMLKKCRWAERNSGLYRQILADLVMYAVGDGITPQSHASTEEHAKLYEEYFREKARRIELTGRWSFWQVQALLLRAMVRDGDAFAGKIRNARGEAKLQLFEAHKVGNPDAPEIPERMWDGIQFGAYGEVVGYNVYRSDGRSRLVIGPAMMHICDHEYVSGARGIPLLQHSLATIQDSQELLALEKQGVKDNADITRVLKKDGGYVDETLAGEISGNRAECGELGAVAAAFGGKLLTLSPGESLESFASARPSPTFTGFLDALNRDIAQGVLPYEFVGDSSKIGGASVRLVVGKAARVFGKYSQIIIEQLCVPTWGYIIGDAIARGELPDDPDWARTSWTTPKSITVDSGRDSANDRADLFAGITNFTELFAQRGTDFRTEMTRRADDMAFIANLARERGLPFELLYMPTNVAPGTVGPIVEQPQPAAGEAEPSEPSEPNS